MEFDSRELESFIEETKHDVAKITSHPTFPKNHLKPRVIASPSTSLDGYMPPKNVVSGGAKAKEK